MIKFLHIVAMAGAIAVAACSSVRQGYEDSAISVHGAQQAVVALCDPALDPLPTCAPLDPSIEAVDAAAVTTFDNAFTVTKDYSWTGLAAVLAKAPSDVAVYEDMLAKLKTGGGSLPALTLEQKARAGSVILSTSLDAASKIQAAHAAGPPDDARLQAALDALKASDAQIQAWPSSQ